MRLISHVQARKQLGINRTKWARWKKAFADIWPPDIEVNGRLFHDGDRWDACVEAIVQRSDPTVTAASAARARAGKHRKDEVEAPHDGAS